MQNSVIFLAVLAILGSALSFQVTPREYQTAARASARLAPSPRSAFAARPVSTVPAASATAGARRRTCVTMQFGEGGGPIEKGTMPTFEEEQEKAFFNSELDNAPATEKVKDPLVLITLGWIVGMFLLAAGLILNGVN